MILPPPSSTLFPYTTLFRSASRPVSYRCSAPGSLSKCTSHPAVRKSTLRPLRGWVASTFARSEEHTSELQSRENLVCRLLLEKKKLIRTHKADVLKILIPNS